MAKATVEGTVYRIGETQSFGAKGFRKREVILEVDDGRYTNHIQVEFIQEGCKDMDGIGLGDVIKCEYVLKGRLWKKDDSTPERCFINAQVTRMRLVERGTPPPVQREYGAGASTVDATSSQEPPAHEDDVPF